MYLQVYRLGILYFTQNCTNVICRFRSINSSYFSELNPLFCNALQYNHCDVQTEVFLCVTCKFMSVFKDNFHFEAGGRGDTDFWLHVRFCYRDLNTAFLGSVFKQRLRGFQVSSFKFLPRASHADLSI